MADPLQPTTELDAVNTMIATIGMAPATSLVVNDVDVLQALNTLRDTSRSVQSGGWDFNTEKDYSLSPNGDGNIVIPPNIVTVVLDKHCFGNNFDAVFRQGKLYDRKAHSFTWTVSVKATVTFLFDFEDLPQLARNYIAIRAARVFQDNAEGLADGHTFTKEDEQTAWIALQNYEAETGNYRLSTH